MPFFIKKMSEDKVSFIYLLANTFYSFQGSTNARQLHVGLSILICIVCFDQILQIYLTY